MNKRQIPIVIFVLLFVYLGKLYFLPSEFDKAKSHLLTLTKLASFEEGLAPIPMFSRIKTLRAELAPNFTVDLTEYLASGGVGVITDLKKQYFLKDFDLYAPIYFQAIKNVNILNRDFKRVSGREYQVIVMGKGNTINKSFDDAYMITVRFDQNWKLDQVRVLSPPLH